MLNMLLVTRLPYAAPMSLILKATYVLTTLGFRVVLPVAAPHSGHSGGGESDSGLNMLSKT
jgi:hypothetical protein